ncbi:MAG: phosphoribosylformylglycinamidine synthase I [Candidatus Cloacimonetes bacterium HGW-Cloacimonetes-1]|nr:MAG: phosphoribosylformylglycinamidine synthase I [Candidatus Cloacimonetes bacterium HGW-Cloacimonetes-1]
MRVSVITFPGSNCDQDALEVFETRGHTVHSIWHKDTDLQNPDLVILPGGFSYGDYLRCGALARFSPIVKEVVAHAQRGGYLWGICNGFQILTETGLLPGTLLMNNTLQFICQHQYIRIETANTPYTHGLRVGTALDIPIAHKEGNYFIDEPGLRELQDQDRIVFRYCDADGNIAPGTNPNGALDDIAGICNTTRNILGMMPHPERAATDSVSSNDGKQIFRALEDYFTTRA